MVIPYVQGISERISRIVRQQQIKVAFKLLRTQKAVSMFVHDSKISYHVHENNHKTDFGSVRVIGNEANRHERLFLEAWVSIKDLEMTTSLSQRFTSLWHAHKSRTMFSRNFTRNFLSARSTCCFLNQARKCHISTDEGLGTSRNVLNETSKN